MEAKSSGARTRAVLSAAVACLLLVLLPPLRTFAAPVYFLLAIAGVAYGLRAVVRYNRVGGAVLIGTLSSAVIAYGALLYNAEQRHQELLGQLGEYSTVSIGRTLLPIPFVSRLSVGRDVSDEELGSILTFEGMSGIEELYLKSEIVTDACLDDVARLKALRYLFIDANKISDDAILSFESRFPQCQVIPYKRSLHGPPTVFLGDGEPSDAADSR